MRISRRLLLTTLCIGLLAALLLPLAVSAPGGGKGKPGTEEPPPPPPLPPIQYTIQLFDFPFDGEGYIYGKNNSGQIVGFQIFGFDDTTTYRAWMYDPQLNPDSAVDLNDIDIIGVPDGYVIGAALDINESGLVVGFLQLPDDSTTESRRGYILDTNTWILWTLPDNEPAYSFAQRINDDGLVLGGYDEINDAGFLVQGGAYVYNLSTDSLRFLNLGGASNRDMCLNNSSGERPAQVVSSWFGGTTLLRVTLPDSTEVLSVDAPDLERVSARGLNDVGTICGFLSQRVATKGKQTETRSRAFRYTDSVQVLPANPTGSSGATDINSSGDVVGGQYLYHDSWEWVDLDNLVTGSPEALAIWFSSSPEVQWICDRDQTGFGMVIGHLRQSDGSEIGFLAVPSSLTP